MDNIEKEMCYGGRRAERRGEKEEQTANHWYGRASKFSSAAAATQAITFSVTVAKRWEREERRGVERGEEGDGRLVALVSA